VGGMIINLAPSSHLLVSYMSRNKVLWLILEQNALATRGQHSTTQQWEQTTHDTPPCSETRVSLVWLENDSMMNDRNNIVNCSKQRQRCPQWTKRTNLQLTKRTMARITEGTTISTREEGTLVHKKKKTLIAMSFVYFRTPKDHQWCRFSFKKIPL